MSHFNRRKTITIRRQSLTTGGTLFAAFLIFTSDTAAQTSTLMTLHAFSGPDGAKPPGGVAIGPGVVLYGVTPYGGSGPCANADFAPGCGTVFSLTPPASVGGAWTEAVIYSFPSQAVPSATLALGPGGVLYGTTAYGGTSNQGTVFSLVPPASPAGEWTETVLYSFTGNSSGGAGPSGVVIGPNGVLYGTTGGGGTLDQGTVFSLAPPVSPGGEWTETVLHSFSARPDGSEPLAGVAIGRDGALYGTTWLGGYLYQGTVFTLTPPVSPGGEWAERVIHNFGGTGDGAKPRAGVAIGTGEVLYGTTLQGGAAGGSGTVFSLTPPASSGDPWAETVLYTFANPGGAEPADPSAPVVIGSGGVLYGTTAYGGIDNIGTVFSLKPPASPGGPWTETVLYGFTGGSGAPAPDGRNPSAGLAIGPNDVLFGTTQGGGTDTSLGTVFLVSP
jgi:uncharacterized repeat protein (TIGR03803 family)